LDHYDDKSNHTGIEDDDSSSTTTSTTEERAVPNRSAQKRLVLLSQSHPEEKTMPVTQMSDTLQRLRARYVQLHQQYLLKEQQADLQRRDDDSEKNDDRSHHEWGGTTRTTTTSSSSSFAEVDIDEDELMALHVLGLLRRHNNNNNHHVVVHDRNTSKSYSNDVPLLMRSKRRRISE
jgi:hypothetical protein